MHGTGGAVALVAPAIPPADVTLHDVTLVLLAPIVGVVLVAACYFIIELCMHICCGTPFFGLGMMRDRLFDVPLFAERGASRSDIDTGLASVDERGEASSPQLRGPWPAGFAGSALRMVLGESGARAYDRAYTRTVIDSTGSSTGRPG